MVLGGIFRNFEGHWLLGFSKLVPCLSVDEVDAMALNLEFKINSSKIHVLNMEFIE